MGLKIQNGFALGFVFIDHSSPVSVLREAVQTQVRDWIAFLRRPKENKPVNIKLLVFGSQRNGRMLEVWMQDLNFFT